MEPGSSWLLICVLILILLSAFFSASETALASLSKIKIRQMVDDGVKNAKRIEKLKKNTSKLLSAILVGNNLVNIAASSIATSIAINLYPEGGVLLATIIMTVVLLIFGEITPKTLASNRPMEVSLFFAKFISFIVFLFTPVIFVLNFITTSILKLFGINIKNSVPIITEEELKTIVNVSHEEGFLESDEKQMINNLFDFGDSKAKDIMIPRTDMCSVPDDISYKELVSVFKTEQFSRLPVYHESIDNITGIAYLKDIAFLKASDFDLSKSLREPLFTYESKATLELLSLMRAKKMQVAIVLDEYGGTAGLITMEDLLEEIVGDISDEYDINENDIIRLKDNEYLVNGSAKLDDVNDILGTSFTSEDFDSLGGYVIGMLGRFPVEKEKFSSEDADFIIEKTDKNRIEKLKLIIKEPETIGETSK
ncbi:MAG: hemolysin family protein [Lachnospiraceae bacterium]|nr:hemolysin family protein [Lachnospiraceae bacterium]